MTEDPIVEEVRRARQEYAARFNYDLAAMVADLQRRTEEARRAGRQVVSFPPRPAHSEDQSAKQAG
jgi:transaldolase